MPGQLNGKRVAILVTDGFEQVEMTEPRKALERGRGARPQSSRRARERSRAGNTPTGATSSPSTCRSTRPTRTTSTRWCCPAA